MKKELKILQKILDIPNLKLGLFCIAFCGILLSPNIVSASVYKYIIEKELDYDSYLIKEYPFGNEYIIEKGIGCLSMWRYTYKPFYINQFGLLDGIGDTIILPDEFSAQTCKVWSVKEISSPSYTYIPSLSSIGPSSVKSSASRIPSPTPRPTPKAIDKISAVDRKAKDFIVDQNVSVTVDDTFRSVFGKKPSIEESKYWKIRARSDKATKSKLQGAMLFQRGKGLTMPSLKK